MKVLLCMRQDCFKNVGSDTVQAVKIKKYLEKKGLEITITTDNFEDYDCYDIVHLFNISSTGEMYKHFKEGKKAKRKIVSTPVYWKPERYFNKAYGEEGSRSWSRIKYYIRTIFENSDLVLTASEWEKNAIEKDFGEIQNNIIARYGVDIEDDKVPLYSFRVRYGIEKYVLCVGGIKGSKNQLTLAKVCNQLGITLVLVGSIVEKKYYQKCMEYKNVIHLDNMERYDLYNAYRFATIHAMPSYDEATVLASLEAAAIGCNIVVSQDGVSKEYFGKQAIYCNPYDELSVYESVKEALLKREDVNLKKDIVETYAWERYADKVLEGYKRILE